MSFPNFWVVGDETRREQIIEPGGGKAREIFLYQKIILLASTKLHSCQNT
ncbi:hypothetical protein FH581_011665 [Leptospira weilii]|nr:hypothetical protein [Leptospira weilii]ULH28899.1 hypothetical protein FH586_02825 [Leptospira weilii]UPY79461.1 hypothetical protein FH581_011665 [Leptospira weilii]